jgi:hypothetical protein
MNRKLIPVLFVVAAAGLIWAVVAGLETESTGRDEAAAVILHAPAGFDVEDLGETRLAAAASALASRAGSQVGVEFVDGGDRVILLADRDRDELTELRAAGTGTIVERTWPGPVEDRLTWASANGNLEAPGLAPASGKNLYH